MGAAAIPDGEYQNGELKETVEACWKQDVLIVSRIKNSRD